MGDIDTLSYKNREHRLRFLRSEARPWIERAVEEAQRVWGNDQTHMAVVLHSLGELERREGNLGAARATLQRSMAILQTAELDAQPGIIDPLLSLAQIAVAQGDPDEAIGYLERAIQVTERTRGIESASLVPVLELYETTLRRAGKIAPADSAADRLRAVRSTSDKETVSANWALVSTTIEE